MSSNLAALALFCGGLGMLFPGSDNFLIALYACYCVGTIAQAMVQKPIEPTPVIDSSDLLKKVLDCQETQMKALDFIVGFIRQTQQVKAP